MPRLYQLLIAAFCLVLLAQACVRKPQSTADVPRLISQSYKISVAPFTQPLTPGQLITGQIPEDQGKAPQDALAALDADLRQALLTKTHRQYDFLPAPHPYDDMAVTHTSGQPNALERWLIYARKHNAQYLLVPQVLDWHEREGSQAGVESSAHARVEFFLLNARDGLVTARSVFEEKQVGLVDNLLGVADFFKRKGQWVTAQRLAYDGIDKAIKELGL